MLCNKIHKVAMATALWTMALLGASLANAQIKFDGTAAGTVIYSAEGMVADASRRMATTGADAGFYAISASSTLLNARKNLSQLAVYRLRQPADNDLWIRVQGSGGLKLFRDPGLSVSGGCFVGITMNTDLSGNGVYIYKIDKDEAPFNASPCSDAPEFPTAYAADGSGPHVIVPLGRKNDFSQDDVTPTTATTAISGGAGMLTVSGYTNSTDAYRGEAGDSQLFTDTVTAVNTASSIAVTIAQATAPATADVETGFTKFTGATPNSATLGSITVAVPTAAAKHVMPNGALAANNLSTIIGANSMVQVASEQGFAYGTFKIGGVTLSPVVPMGVTLAMGATCSKPGADVTLAGCSTALKPGAQSFTMDVITPAMGAMAATIPNATFQATAMFVDTANTALNAALPADEGPKDIGRIRRNGSTFQIPMLTTSSNYNHRIILVNRGERDARYTMAFVSEDGTTATGGAGATGVLGAGETTVLRVADVVTLTGNSFRTAATVNVAGASDSIDVLTQLVSLSDRSTDSVRYDADQVRIPD